jgi:hypothetical protein
LKNLLIATFLVLIAADLFGALHAAEFFCRSGDVTCLVNAIKKANSTRRPDTIKLEAGVYTLRTVAETNDDGPNGLPSIKTEITIVGNGPNSTVIERDPTFERPFEPGAPGPRFRILYVTEAGNLTLDSLAIKGGVLFSSINDNGPGVFSRGITTITNSIITQNIGVFGSGGGIFNMGGTLTVSDSVIRDNQVIEGEGGGGGVRADFPGTTTITNTTISNNEADEGGGGIDNGGHMTILNSAIIDNFAAFGVGAGISSGGTLIVTNTTIANNVKNGVFGGGAGIANTGGTVAVVNGTIVNNVNDVDVFAETFGGGGIGNFGGTFQLHNTIVALNTSTVRGPDCEGSITSGGNNLIGDTFACDVTLLSSDLTGDPKLGALVGAGEGGQPGRAFFPVLPDSPVIDAGNPDTCPETDQLGNPRRGICDIGAIEFHDRLLVTIDFRPRSDKNKIDPNSKGTVAVAIVSDSSFDASNVDLNTVRFGAVGTEASPSIFAKRDFDRDKDGDLILRFEIRETGIECGDTSVSLTGKTLDGIPILGSSSIRTVDCDRKRSHHHLSKNHGGN